MNFKINILKVTISKHSRGRKEGHAAVYFSLQGENLIGELMNRRSRPYDEFRKVLNAALEMAAEQDESLKDWKETDFGWNQYAGCTCPCSPGFSAKRRYLTHDIFVTYSVVEGSAEEPKKEYSKRTLESATFEWAERKDEDRARNLKTMGEAEKMAKLITDPAKMVRRLKAVKRYAPTLRSPFMKRMKEMGFSDDQITNVLGIAKSVKVMLPA